MRQSLIEEKVLSVILRRIFFFIFFLNYFINLHNKLNDFLIFIAKSELSILIYFLEHSTKKKRRI